MIINIIFTLLMLALAIWDLKSFGSNNHKDFKSLIMSIGILGTFAGIFVGLIGFDTRDLLSSVPMLLDGLKIAFYTSIVGMGLAIALSIYQKGKSKATENSEIDFIATQAHKLDELMHLRELIHINTALRDIKGEFVKKENFEKDLKQMLKDIDVSLHKALETLASGASKELIRALEIVISDFNNNLKEQFGENFKQLNEATYNMLSWQQQYKEQILDNTNSMQIMQKTLKDAQDSMQQATESILANKENLIQIQEYNKQNNQIQENLLHALKMLNTLEQSFEEKLQVIATLKDSSLEALKDSKDFIKSLQQAKETLQGYLQNYEEKLLSVLEASCMRLDDANATLQTQNSEILESIKVSYNDFKDSLQHANIEVLESFKEASKTSNNLAKVINDDIVTKSNSIIHLNESFKNNADSMLEKLKMVSHESISKVTQMQEKMHTLYDDQFASLHTKMTHTTEILQETLANNANNLENFTKDSIETLTNAFEKRDQILQNMLQNNYEHIMNNIDALHQSFQDKISKDYQYMQDKILETSQTAYDFLKDCAKELEDSGKINLHTSIEMTGKLAKEHINTLQNMQEDNFIQINEHALKARDFIMQTQETSIQALTHLHTTSLEKIKESNEEIAQNAVENLSTLHSAYQDNIVSSLQTTHDHLEKELSMLHDATKDTLQNMQDGLQTQHTKTTDSIAAVLKNSSQHFIQTSDDFVELLKGQYKRMNTTFDKQAQEMQEFLQTQTNALNENLLAQNENLKNTFDTQTEQLQQDLTQKGEILHEFLQTQTTCLDTNLQQMLNKFNKMLEHNYMNLSDMLEKDNNLIVKSLDSQAINLSNSLINSHQKLDDFLHSTYEKLTHNVDSLLTKVTNNSTTLSRNLELTGDALKDNLQGVIDKLQQTNAESQKNYDEKLAHTLNTQQAIITDIQAKSQTFYDTIGKNLENFTQSLQTTSSDIHTNCQSILNDMQSLKQNNQNLSQETLQVVKDSYTQLYGNLDKNLNTLTQGLVEQFSNVMQKNESLLQSFDKQLSSFDTTLQNFESNTKTSFENLNTHFKNLCVQYIKLMQASMQANLKNQAQATEELHRAVNAVEQNVKTLATSSDTLLTKQKETLQAVVQHFKNSTDELVKQGELIHKNLGTNLETLDSKMEQMTQSFANNYEWFLKKVKEIMGVA
ncbi:hypothetical protein [Helicobacter trogontum]|uniref:MotA/TolQ/ExbB proton channel domain-containing protein n=1 Tax=Helicobacter trogontum TaxID=50960 RepID=A0A4U8TE09_9HELI|nr:hypothetical protein [Helicobacter trogontum]TLD98123.1 hypothetical protein LS80_005755 [Helicobacter trogontum]